MRKQNQRALRKNKKPKPKVQRREENIVVTPIETEAIEFLKVNKKPWDAIESKWKETHKIRMNDLKNNKISLETTTSKFPLVTCMELGPLLVTHSCKFLNPM